MHSAALPEVPAALVDLTDERWASIWGGNQALGTVRQQSDEGAVLPFVVACAPEDAAAERWGHVGRELAGPDVGEGRQVQPDVKGIRSGC